MSEREPWCDAPDVFAEMRRISEMVAALPPRPRCFMAHHSVPYGQVFRQWNTHGDLIVWVNRGEIADLPRQAAKRADGYSIAPNAIDTELLLSIPVVISESANSQASPE